MFFLKVAQLTTLSAGAHDSNKFNYLDALLQNEAPKSRPTGEIEKFEQLLFGIRVKPDPGATASASERLFPVTGEDDDDSAEYYVYDEDDDVRVSRGSRSGNNPWEYRFPPLSEPADYDFENVSVILRPSS